MTSDIKNKLIDCLKNIDNIKGESEKEISKTIALLRDTAANIPNDRVNRYVACYLLGLIFTQSPALMTPSNKRVLNKFAKEIKLDETLDNLLKPKTR